MTDLLKIKDVHSSIRYIDDGQIPKANLEEEKIIISRGTKKGDMTTIKTIINYTRMKKPSKPFKLRVVAESRKSGKRQVRKRDYTYETSTLNKAVLDAESKRLLLLQEAEAIVELPEEITEIPTFEDALQDQLKHRENEYKANNRPHNDKNIRQFAEKWLKPINKKRLDKITKADLTAIMANMNKPDGTPLAIRTKRTVYQIINPVYTWLNEETVFKVDSPAHIKKLKKPDNERGCPFEVEEGGDIEKLKLQFRKLYYYALDRTGNRTHDQLRGVYIWLMHGRRLNEVLSLKWEHIDMGKKTYKITGENNKARKDMEYILTGYQLEAIGRPKKKGWVFPSINDTKKALSKETIRNHDIGLFEEGMHKHDLRHCIGGYLINNGTLKEVIGVILGHTQNKSITDRYAQVRKQTANKAILSMLDDLLGIQLSAEEISKHREEA